MSTSSGLWSTETRERIREVQDGLLATAELARASNADPRTTDTLLAPYRELLDGLYERDLSLATLRDESDLLLHVVGPAAGPSPRVSTLARILTVTRDQVTRLAKQFAGITDLRVPERLDMAFTGTAGGSLFVGFSVASDHEANLTKQAIAMIAEVTQIVADEMSIKELSERIDDPAARDMALAAVRHLSPSNQIGIKEIELLGRQVLQPTSLTTETRRLARGIMVQRASHEDPVSFVGTVREVDLDASRFEIRNVEGHPDAVRCAHDLDEDEVKELVDKRVRVKGIPEYGRGRKSVRLLWVNEVEPLD